MSQEEDQYRAGHCNIGAKEISVRKKFLSLFLITTASLTFLSFYYCNSLVCWIALFGSAFAMIVVYLEIKYRFCILFGFFSLYNFGKLGNLNEVQNTHYCKKDRKKVLEMVLQSLIVSLAYSSVVHFFATSYHL